MLRIRSSFLVGLASIVFAIGSLSASPSLMENLGRGVVAVRSSSTEVFVSWRVLGTDYADTAFNLYRSTGGGAPLLLNPVPITGATNFADTTVDLTQANAYSVRPVIFGVEQAAGGSFTVAAGAPVQQYLRVPLQQPAAGVTPTGEAYTYSPNDCSPGDLDGDGEYDLVVKWEPSNAKDNSQSGHTGNVYLDGYKIDGTFLWRIDLGVNIRAGAHYTQFQVFDLDGDGRAEVSCRTAEGSRDALGNFVADPARFTGTLPPVEHTVDRRNTGGYILGGPEFLTIFNGQTGAELASTNYNPPRHPDTLFPTTAQINAIWGDNYGNRIDRFLAGVAYLDGSRPSLVMCRGYYTRSVVVAYDWRDGQLTQRWIFDTNPDGGAAVYPTYRGQGAHSLTIGDVDGDGKDEIVYGAACIDDNGVGLYSTTWAHGDALHFSDMDPDRPGLEVWMPHESPSSYGANAAEMHDAATGALLLGVQASGDIGRGVAFDVDPRYRGYEMWASGGTGGMYTAQLTTANALLGPRGVQISSGKPSLNFGVWWDGDLLRELLDNVTISKWNWITSTTSSLVAPAGVASNNSTKATPNLSGDILGDWREEVIWRETGNNALRIYTTTIPTTHRIYTLMHDRQYRAALAWQNTAYNQPPHPGFFLGDGMDPAPVPNIVTSLSVLLGPAAPELTAITTDSGVSASDFSTNDTTLVLSGAAQAGATVNVTRLGVGLVGTADASGAGSWSFDYTGTVLPAGEISFVFSATDAANNTGASSAPEIVTIDTTAPDAPVIASISLEAGFLVFTGTAEPGSAVEVSLTGGGSMGVDVADEGGFWTVTYTGPSLPSSALEFTARSTDIVGNTSPASSGTSVNTSISTPSISGVVTDSGISATDGVTNDNRLVVNGTAGAGATVHVSILGGDLIGAATADAGGLWTVDHTGTALADGMLAIAAVTTSPAGNSPSSPAYFVTVDTAAPSIVSINRFNPSAATTSAANLTFRVTFSEEVAGLDSADFTAVFTGTLTGAISSVEADAGGVFDVAVGPLTGEGTLRLDLNASSTGITDVAGNLLPGGFSSGQVYTRSLTGNGTWTRSATAGAWSDHTNWLEGIVAAGAGTTADFSTLELVEENSIHLDASRTVGNLVFGDTDIASAASWTVDNNANPANVLTLGVVAGAPTVTVNPLGLGARVTLDTSLAGNQGLTKLGTGPLVLRQPNALTGAININGGTVTLQPAATLSNGNAQINLGTNTQLILNGGTLANNNLVTAVTSSLVINDGTASLLDFRTNSDFGGTLRVNGGTVTVRDINVRRNSAASPDFNSGVIIAGGSTTAVTIGLGTNNSTGAMSIQGGSLTATGAVTIANQTSGGRGGAMRVLSGTFVSTDAVNGLIITRRNNNIGSATFTGGMSAVERIVIGYDATVASGSGTLTVNGGTLYVGAGGIVGNGSGTFATAINLSSGTLGANADWSTARAITLPTGGNITLKAADATDAPHTITLAGVLSGAGGLTKTGAGTLALTAASTYTGATVASAGLLDLDGSLAGSVTVQAGGAIGGAGAIGGSLVLEIGSTLTADPLAAIPLAIAGPLAGGGVAGARTVLLTPSGEVAQGAVSTLATFGSTDLVLADLALAPTSGYLGVLELDTTSLRFRVTGVGATAEYTHWAFLEGLPPGLDGPDDNPSGDGIPNLLKFVLALDPNATTAEGIAASTIEEGGQNYPAIAYIRRKDLGGVTAEVLVSPDLGFALLLGAVEVSAADNGDGTESVIARSAVPTSEQPQQFFRIAATLPEN